MASCTNQSKEILDSLIIQYKSNYQKLIRKIEWQDTFLEGINKRINVKVCVFLVSYYQENIQLIVI